MATISLTLPQSGTVITAGLHSSNYGTLQSTINGGLDNNNFSTGKIFDTTKLMQNGALDKQTLLWSNGGSTWQPGYPPGYEYSYVEFTGTVTAASSTEASAVTVASAAAVTFDGSTKAKVEFFAPQLVSSDNTNGIVLTLFDGTTASPVGQLAKISASGGTFSFPGGTWSRELTPSAASHTYFVGILDAGAVTSNHAKVIAGAAGTGAMVPGYIKVSRA